MPALSNMQPHVKEFITLPQALHWIVSGKEPDLTGELEGFPSAPEGDASCEDLYRCWITGQLELFGNRGKKASLKRDPVLAREEVIFSEFEDFSKIPSELIMQFGIDAIDWERSTLSRIFYNEDDGEWVVSSNDDDSGGFDYWERLCVRWVDLRKLTAGREPLGAAKRKRLTGRREPSDAATRPLDPIADVYREDSDSDEKRGPGAPKRPDWTLIAALTAIIRERERGSREVSSELGTHNRLKLILEAAGYRCPDNPNPPSRSGFKKEALDCVGEAEMLYEKGIKKSPSRSN